MWKRTLVLVEKNTKCTKSRDQDHLQELIYDQRESEKLFMLICSIKTRWRVCINGIVQNKNSIIIYSLLCCSKPVWSGTQKNKCFCPYHDSQWDPKQPKWTLLTFSIWTKTSAVKLVINHIQNKHFCLHNICVYTVYIYYVYINANTCMYIFK